jgi:pyruvate ferredoxin oxidoreductase alpha subunit
MLDPENPVTYGAQTEGEWHFEHKMRQNHALVNSIDVVKQTFADFKEFSGREYHVVEPYQAEDAEEIIIAMGSVIGTAQLAVNKLREQGRKVGLVGIRLWRPFPKDDLFNVIKNAKSVAVMDRAAPMGTTGALFQEVSAVLIQNEMMKPVLDYIYGLGGRDTTYEHITRVFNDLKECSDAGKRVKPLLQTINLRGKALAFYE